MKTGKDDDCLSTPPATGETELPPLPEEAAYMHDREIFSNGELPDDGTNLYTAEQFRQGQRDAIAHYLRKQAGQVDVKTWQERMYTPNVDGLLPESEIDAANSEIADLRAQLASAQQAKEYEQRHAVESEKALAQVQAQLARTEANLQTAVREAWTRTVALHRAQEAAVAGQEGEQPTIKKEGN